MYTAPIWHGFKTFYARTYCAYVSLGYIVALQHRRLGGGGGGGGDDQWPKHDHRVLYVMFKTMEIQSKDKKFGKFMM
jgi:hypothetical protein